jgi:23S rRNA (cytidine2498-2'-O)-methyltransferase
MASFYFALTNVDAEPLLKAEVKLRFPELKLSYSRPGFITFKADYKVSFNPLFARVSGTTLGKYKKSELKFSKAWVWSRTQELSIPADLKELSDNTLFKIGEKVTLIMMIGEDEFWVGEYELLPTHFQTPGEESSVLVRDVPSRAYYKIAEAFEAYDLPFKAQERVLELGSAPGGASLFLLEQGMHVLGVDPALMDSKVMDHQNFRHLKRPFETLSELDFKNTVDWIISDINLPPTVVLKEIYRLLTFLRPRGLVITLKMNEQKHFEVIATVRKKIMNMGFDKVSLKYLPSHRKEIALIALNS